MARKLKTEEHEELPDDEMEDEELSEDEVEDLETRSGASGIGLFTAGLLLGALVGAGAIWLTAPARGDITRRRMKRRLKDFREEARDHVDDWREDARRGLARQRRRIRRRIRRGGE